jgi:hypothetical protein
MTTALWIVGGLTPFVAFGIGWAFGYAKAGATYAERVGEMGVQIDNLEEEVGVLGQALAMRHAADPELGDLRVPEDAA